MKYSFSPLANKHCHLLILGSLPGDMSLGKGQYYAHPRNCFWRMVCDILGESYHDE